MRGSWGKDGVHGKLRGPRQTTEVPSDGRLLELAEIMTNEAPLTGESEDVKKLLVLTGEALDEPFARNMCFASTVVRGERAESACRSIRRYRRGSNTMLTG